MNEAGWKNWLQSHSTEVLQRVGIGKGHIVLDFGCGVGAYAIPAAKRVGGEGKVYALDKSTAALQSLERRAVAEGLQNIETLNSSDMDIGLGEESVDLVLLHDVIHLIDERAVLFEQTHRVLKPGGRVSVYPMHLGNDALSREMQKSGFSLAAIAYEGNILVFEKPAKR